MGKVELNPKGKSPAVSKGQDKNKNKTAKQPAATISLKNKQAQKPKPKLSVGQKAKALGKGVGRFFKNMVCDEKGKFSGKKALTTAGIAVGCVALEVATGGAATPFLLAGGALISGSQIVKGASKVSKAKTAKQEDEALQEIGEGITGGALTVVGARSFAGAKAAKLGKAAEALKEVAKGNSSAEEAIGLMRTGSRTQRQNAWEALRGMAKEGSEGAKEAFARAQEEQSQASQALRKSITEQRKALSERNSARNDCIEAGRQKRASSQQTTNDDVIDLHTKARALEDKKLDVETGKSLLKEATEEHNLQPNEINSRRVSDAQEILTKAETELTQAEQEVAATARKFETIVGEETEAGSASALKAAHQKALENLKTKREEYATARRNVDTNISKNKQANVKLQEAQEAHQRAQALETEVAKAQDGLKPAASRFKLTDEVKTKLKEALPDEADNIAKLPRKKDVLAKLDEAIKAADSSKKPELQLLKAQIDGLGRVDLRTRFDLLKSGLKDPKKLALGGYGAAQMGTFGNELNREIEEEITAEYKGLLEQQLTAAKEAGIPEEKLADFNNISEDASLEDIQTKLEEFEDMSRQEYCNLLNQQIEDAKALGVSQEVLDKFTADISEDATSEDIQAKLREFEGVKQAEYRKLIDEKLNEIAALGVTEETIQQVRDGIPENADSETLKQNLAEIEKSLTALKEQAPQEASEVPAEATPEEMQIGEENTQAFDAGAEAPQEDMSEGDMSGGDMSEGNMSEGDMSGCSGGECQIPQGEMPEGEMPQMPQEPQGNMPQGGYFQEQMIPEDTSDPSLMGSIGSGAAPMSAAPTQPMPAMPSYPQYGIDNLATPMGGQIASATQNPLVSQPAINTPIPTAIDLQTIANNALGGINVPLPAPNFNDTSMLTQVPFTSAPSPMTMAPQGTFATPFAPTPMFTAPVQQPMPAPMPTFGVTYAPAPMVTVPAQPIMPAPMPITPQTFSVPFAPAPMPMAPQGTFAPFAPAQTTDMSAQDILRFANPFIG
ncbi:MAG: hypothetical protein PHC64_08630 [Candidatus Gastranaerophilales bacterium]|nr:hypothetical protein [Candidatus Gastranaerophilales bacterium]